MRQVGLAMLMYANDNRGVIVPAGMKYSSSSGDSFDTLLKPYLKPRVNGPYFDPYDFTQNPIFQCPSDQVYRSWLAPSQQDFKRSYAMIQSRNYGTNQPTLGTGMVTDVSSTGGVFPGANIYFRFIKFSQVKHSSEVLLLGEWFSGGNVAGNTQWDPLYSIDYSVINCPGDQLAGINSINAIHGGKWNYLLCDGSVQRLDGGETLQGNAALPTTWKWASNHQYTWGPWVNGMWLLH